LIIFRRSGIGDQRQELLLTEFRRARFHGPEARRCGERKRCENHSQYDAALYLICGFILGSNTNTPDARQPNV
jgi:hypothetical protein